MLFSGLKQQLTVTNNHRVTAKRLQAHCTFRDFGMKAEEHLFLL